VTLTRPNAGVDDEARGREIRAALARPDFYPDRPSSVEERETHISWVFLAGDRAYKLKKPVVMDFLDYGTAQRRRHMCREEVRLNRRLAPDIYLGVRGVAPTAAGYELTDDRDPRAVEFVVEMRRYDERQTLAAAVERESLTPDVATAVGRRIAAFHAQAPPVDSQAIAAANDRRFERNLHELFQCLDGAAETGRVLALERFAHAFIQANADTFRARAVGGLVREGHGDMRAEHVLINGEVRIVDCVEFDRELRELDVSDDLAFLIADLAARGAAPFGELIVAAYRAAGGDPGDAALIAFHAVYRALVRSKVALLTAAQHADGCDEHRRARTAGLALIGVAERFAWRARLPLTIVICGVPASGKSVLADALADASGLPRLSSDLLRKQLAGVPAEQRAPKATYGAEWNARTYAELGRRAADQTVQAGGAVIDATFRHRADREAFRSSFASSSLLFVECLAPRPVLCERAAARQRDHRRVSDADLSVVIREQAAWDRLDEVAADAHLSLRTDRPVAEIVADVMALLDRRLARRSDPARSR
jgi:hypothetical protein